ncbi:MAG TPA: hypothetical protein VN958_04975 [Chitinophagaceae bacterium]|nr:hypothetical protein [Chitinophagaceae bacterium]
MAPIFIYIGPEHEFVMVVRWIENNAVDGIVQKSVGSVEVNFGCSIN